MELINLLLNENMKIYRRLRSWVLFAVLLAIVCLFSAAYNTPSAGVGADWRERLQNQMEQDARTAESKKSTEKAKVDALNELKLNQYRLEHDLPPQSMVPTPWKTIQRSADLTVIVTIFTVIIAADMVAGEFTWGTVKLLLIRPYSRSKILLGKYITTLMFAVFMLAVLMVSSFLLNAALSRFHYIGLPSVSIDAGGNIHKSSMLLRSLRDYGFHSIELLLVVTMAFMLSTVFRSSLLSVGITMFITFTGQVITALLIRYSWGKYWLFANTDLSVYLSGRAPAEGMTLAFSISVLAVYYILFIAISWIIFNKRDVAV